MVPSWSWSWSRLWSGLVWQKKAVCQVREMFTTLGRHINLRMKSCAFLHSRQRRRQRRSEGWASEITALPCCHCDLRHSDASDAVICAPGIVTIGNRNYRINQIGKFSIFSLTSLHFPSAAITIHFTSRKSQQKIENNYNLQ